MFENIRNENQTEKIISLLFAENIMIAPKTEFSLLFRKSATIMYKYELKNCYHEKQKTFSNYFFRISILYWNEPECISFIR